MSKRAPRSLPLENLGSLITIKGTNDCLGFLFHDPEHGTYDATHGRVEVSKADADLHNQALSVALVEGLDRCRVGEGNTFYLIKSAGGHRVQTWIGTVVAELKPGAMAFVRAGHAFEVVPARGDDESAFVRRIA